jgi:hypothetical protein
MQTGTSAAETALTAPPAPKPPETRKMDVGTVAAISVAISGLSVALGYLLAWLAGVPPYIIPLYILGVILLISMPSMILAALKLHQRNLGPILDANGWAVNAKAKMNIPFGGVLTQTPKLPAGSHRDPFDPFAEKHTGRNWAIATVVLVLIALGLWYFGVADRVLPGVLPESNYMEHVRLKHEQEKAAADKAALDRAAAAAAIKAETNRATTSAPAAGP